MQIKDMTVEDLQAMIDQTVERKLQELFGEPDTRTLEEVFESIERNRWSPPPGGKSSLEYLREDRER